MFDGLFSNVALHVFDICPNFCNFTRSRLLSDSDHVILINNKVYCHYVNVIQLLGSNRFTKMNDLCAPKPFNLTNEKGNTLWLIIILIVPYQIDT